MICPLVALLAALGCGEGEAPVRSAPGIRRPIEFETADGWVIEGDLYLPEKDRWRDGTRGALLLLHMFGKDASSWGPLEAEAVRRGMAVLAIDFRGHGGSRPVDGSRRTAKSFLPGKDFRAMTQDVDAALDFLYRKHSVPRHRVVIAGASMGGSVALLSAAEEKAVPGVAVLSPGLVWKGLVIAGSVQELGRRPLLMIASTEDEYSVRSMKELARRAVSGQVTLQTVEGKSRGTEMFTTHPVLVEKAVAEFAAGVLDLPEY